MKRFKHFFFFNQFYFFCDFTMQLLNQTIKGYKFINFIDKGSFGAVYKAEKDNAFYAVKIFDEEYVLAEFKRHGQNNNRLKREIEIIKSVSHKNLVKYVDDFVDEDETGKKHFLVMEYIEGEDLESRIQRNGLIEENLTIKIFKQVLEGIEHLHNSRGDDDDIGIIHRDLKPANILINNNGEIKIVDFGLSKAIDFTSITNTGDVIGSPIYQSPEQIVDSKHIDKRSDFYTLGVILYQMLTGEFPYDYRNIHDLYEKIKNTPAIPPRRKNISVSNHIENIILKLLEKRPYKRFTKTSDIVEAINFKEEISKRKTYDLSPRFILRLWNDKGVLEDFTKRNKQFGNVVFPANLENVKSCKGLKSNIQSDVNIKLIVDPATTRLAYDTYTDVKGVCELPYTPSDYKVITPSYLEDYKAQKKYVEEVIDKQIELQADILLSPFHYTHNSSMRYGPTRNLTAEWFDLDCKLIKESIDYRNYCFPNKEIYMGICINADALKDEEDKKYLLNIFSSFESDGFLIYVDCIDNKSNEITLYHYIDFLDELQEYTQKPVIAGRVNSGLGLGLLSLGISGFTSGTARFESFYEDLYKEAGTAYNMYTRYYFPELLTTVPINRKTPTKFDQITDSLGTCDCHYCSGKTKIEIVKDKNAHLHFLENIYKEIERIKPLNREDKINSYLSKIDDAINSYGILKHVFKADDYSFLNKWKNVFTKLKEKKHV